MSIGRVRVYELTRELDLETKDILAICEQLNIAVKSHSSTITESEAEQIRAAVPERKSSSPASPRVKEPVKELTEKDSRSAKQQILTVSKPTARLNSPPAAVLAEPPAIQKTLEIPQDRLATLPVSPTEPTTSGTVQTETPVQIVQPPVRPEETPDAGLESEVKPQEDAVEAEPKTESKEAKTGSAAPRSPEIVKPVPPANRVKQAAASDPLPPAASPKVPTKQPKPQPSLEAAPTKSEDKPASKPPSKAVVKPDREKVKPGNRSDASPQIATTPKRPQPHRPTPVKDAVLIERGITTPTDPPRPLRAPMAPIRPADRGTSELPEKRKTDAGAPSTGPAAPVLLDRPTSIRPSKRTKVKKDEEDQDMLELKEKASKLHKPKRYLKVIEDEDIIDDLEVTEMPQISLSLARPTARPKQRLSKPPTTAAEVKAGISRLSKKTSSRDRRTTQEVVVEKPSKITLQDSITVQELANQLMLPETDIIRALFLKGLMVNINQTLDIPTASMVAAELGYEVEQIEAEAPARKVTEMIEVTDLENLQRRPPVVTIMGHVDHGKTTLLDSIRKSKVAQGEAGGITQHIGAYHVDVEHAGKKQQIVFLDTPGHEAFTAMRARGARVTDVAVLVVAADDGVRPQTIEAISHARAAKVPIVVAINKVDKPGAQPERVQQELTEYGLVPEEWGGDTIVVLVSAIKGDNLDTLLEMILLVSEVEDLQANPNRTARGTVIEANLDKARGPVATFLVQNGTLRVGDILVAGSAFGKVRAMVDDQGKRVEVASPSFAVEVLGLSEVPAAGDEFEVFTDEKLARATASERTSQQRQSRLQQSMASRRVTLGTVSAKVQEGELKELNLILKADVQGSVEAILGALEQLPQQEVQLRVLLSAAGEITENDVDLAAASDAVIIGFNTSMASGARQAADELGVDVRDYNIIYKLLEDVQGAMEGLLEPELVEEPLGQAEVRALFTIGRGVVAGCYVLSGKLVRNCKIRIKRNGVQVYETALDSLKRMKEDVKEVAAGFECGVALPKFQDWQVGDIIEAFRMVTKRRTLST